MKTNIDEKYMRLALNIAKKGEGKVLPNPMVGCVIVQNSKIISTGYHSYFGAEHAEVVALKKFKNISNTIMYINLEPCSHSGKTPPCTKSIIESGIKKLVISMKDPNSLVNGKGIKKLKQNKIHITSGILENQAKELNRVYIKYITTGLPYVILKTAMSVDGKIATNTGDSKWISSAKSREFVYKLRSKVDAVLAGKNTVLKDNPELTSHSFGKNPVRIIVDNELDLDINLKVFDMRVADTIIITDSKNFRKKKEKIKKLSDLCSGIIFLQSKHNRIDFIEIMKKLSENKIYSVLIEGGAETNTLSLKAGIVDELLFFVSPKLIGGECAKTPFEGEGINKITDAISLRLLEYKKIENDIMVRYKLTN